MQESCFLWELSLVDSKLAEHTPTGSVHTFHYRYFIPIGFEIETELTIHALEQRLAVGEMDCDYKSRPSGSSSKLNTIQDGFKILRVILVLIKDERPLFFFSSFAIFFVFFSLALGIPIIINFMETGLVEKIPSAILAAVNMVIAFLSFFSGLILDVIKKSRHERKRLNYLMMKK